MPNKRYIAGRNLEYDCKAFLETRGYRCFRTAGSHSVADVIAFSRFAPGDVIWVQCKYGQMVPLREFGRLMEQAKECDVLPVCAWRTPHKPIHWTDLSTGEEMFN